MRSVILAIVICLVGAFAAVAQKSSDDTTTADQEKALEERAAATLETLASLISAKQTIAKQVADLVILIEDAAEAEKEPLTEDLKLLNDELAAIEDQISVVATGISERDYRQVDGVEFDLRKELENLVQPFMSLLLGATEEARRIEATRRALANAQLHLQDSDAALKTVSAALENSDIEVVSKELAVRQAIWTERYETNESQVAALTQQLEDLLTSRVSAGTQVQSAMQGFFRERGLSLLLGVLAFVGVMMACRLTSRMVSRFWTHNEGERTFYTRLVGLLFGLFAIAASLAAMLIVFNLRNDWLLLGLATVLVIALLWIGIRMMPGLFEQGTVLLNLGAVQEDERVVYGGVPYKVQKLSFYTDLVNPALDGGEFTLPVRELIGLHSRPAAENEAWFPSMRGDWVKLMDGTSGQVIVQTPEMVVVEHLGGARATYQTADYLAQTPVNLSHGYRVEIVFGIDYRHQKEATGPILQTLQKEVTKKMTAFVGEDDLRAVSIEFLSAAASSLDYEVEVDLRGEAAHRFEEIERELARVVVEIATENDWNIPFQQIVLHNAQQT